MSNNTFLQSILADAPKKDEDNQDDFISYFNEEHNNFDKPDNLPHYLD